MLEICPPALEISNLNLWVVLGAGLVDSINPCAIAVLVLFIGYTSMVSREHMIKLGLLYVGVVYLTYLALGLGILRFLSIVPTQFTYFVGALAIAFGVISINDYRTKKRTLKIPDRVYPFIHRQMNQLSILTAVFLAFSVSLFELPCTGGIYLCILTMLRNDPSALVYLLMYNLMFVMPLVGILGLSYSGKKLVTVCEEGGCNIKGIGINVDSHKLKLLMGFVMIGLGVIVIV